MSHRAMIDGTVYEVTGGKTMVDGTVYNITGGKTMVDGTVYGIDFGSAEIPVSFDGTHTIYGDGRKGWIEITGNGTLTILQPITADIYLLGDGSNGSSGRKMKASGTWSVTSGKGGNGGKYLEVYGQTLTGAYAAEGFKISDKNGIKLGDWAASSGTSFAKGKVGVDASGTWDSKNGFAMTESSSSFTGGNGRQPFTGHSPMSDGMAAKKLGPSGGSGGIMTGTFPVGGTSMTSKKVQLSSGGIGADGSGTGTGAGGTGGFGVVYVGSPADNATYGHSGGNGSSGIIIVRWGY